MTILILVNTRYKGGLSGGDAIYESFKKYWPCEFIESRCDIEYTPFFLCYLQRLLQSIVSALFDRRDFDIVYSSSDFLPDSIPGFIYKLKGKKWIAGYFLQAFKENPIHYYTQKVARKLIQWFSDMVIVTNPTMYDIFPGKTKTWINGGIDLSLAGLSDKPKIYDAVFCGRIHPTKGIDELLEIWELVRYFKPNAKLAIIGDGDLGIDYIKHKLFSKYGLKKYNGIDLLGYMGNERFEIYKQSKVVLYPTPLKYDHFSMAPVEAMACGCPIAAFNNPVNKSILPYDQELSDNINLLSINIRVMIDRYPEGLYGYRSERAKLWAQKYDYKTQSLRVWEDVNANSSNWFKGNGRKFSVPSFKRSSTDNTFKS